MWFEVFKLLYLAVGLYNVYSVFKLLHNEKVLEKSSLMREARGFYESSPQLVLILMLLILGLLWLPTMVYAQFFMDSETKAVADSEKEEVRKVIDEELGD